MRPKLARLVRRSARPLAIIGRVLGILILLLVVLPSVVIGLNCVGSGGPATPPTVDVSAPTAGLPDYARVEDQTYLTYPEWYIVYSADEYGAYIRDHRPSGFPYFQAVGQYWGIYFQVCASTRDAYPFNVGYHFSNLITGVSFSVENVIKGLYENTVGRLSEALSSGEVPQTDEDAYARKVAVEFGAFIHTIPWYQFPYGEKLGGLWAESSGWGADPVRKWERRLSLTFEYAVKAAYGWFIRGGTAATYAPEKLEIQAWVDGLTPAMLATESEIRVIKPIGGQSAIISIPRYEAFTQLVPKLTQQGLKFVEIAGNDEILITAFAPRDWRYDLQQGTYLFAEPVLTDPDLARVAIRVPVKALPEVLADLSSEGVRLEHIYDY